MKLLIALALLGLSVSVICQDTVSVNVTRNKHDENPQTNSVEFSLQASNYHVATIWRTPKNIVCTVELWGSNEVEGSFTCQSPENYKAQIIFDCTNHKSQESAAYLFFGVLNQKDESGNFYVWCE